MKKLKQSSKLHKIAKSTILFLTLTTFSGCNKTIAPTVRSEICSSRYQLTVLVKKDFENIAQINKNPEHQETIKKLVKNIVVNEKEFK